MELVTDLQYSLLALFATLNKPACLVGKAPSDVTSGVAALVHWFPPPGQQLTDHSSLRLRMWRCSCPPDSKTSARLLRKHRKSLKKQTLSSETDSFF
jgi:hypothetical protein